VARAAGARATRNAGREPPIAIPRRTLAWNVWRPRIAVRRTCAALQRRTPACRVARRATTVAATHPSATRRRVSAWAAWRRRIAAARLPRATPRRTRASGVSRRRIAPATSFATRRATNARLRAPRTRSARRRPSAMRREAVPERACNARRTTSAAGRTVIATRPRTPACSASPMRTAAAVACARTTDALAPRVR
jgi:hypothetical protein